MQQVVFQLENVTKIYPGQKIPANDDISMQIQQGEIFGFLGDNGAGKTTLVRQMVNLLKSTSGAIYLFGKRIDSDPLYVPYHVGYMPQDSYSLNNMTVGEALYYTARLRGLTRLDAQQERQHLLESWEIGSLRDQINTRLSGGQRRLLRLTVAMTGSPPVLILDEPTSDLDPQRRNLVWDRTPFRDWGFDWGHSPRSRGSWRNYQAGDAYPGGVGASHYSTCSLARLVYHPWIS